jgi:NADPH:quinone reductase-like Zn-dependent oxidoreductase
MLALVAAPDSPSKAELREVPEPTPAADEAVVEVRAVSLNRGEVHMMRGAKDGARVGWDLSGTVVSPARDGSGSPAGARVVGLVRTGAWAQRVAVSTKHLAELPAEVGFSAASTLPVAGLTAMRALAVGGLLLGQRILITGAAGGVGRFAVQLAKMAGAEVTGVVGSAARGEKLPELGAHFVAVGIEAANGPFDLILESAGGSSLAWALQNVAPNGAVVSFGNSSGQPTTLNIASFFPKNGARLQGLVLFPELTKTGTAVRDLTLLATSLASQRLDPQIDMEASFRDPGPAFAALLERRVQGKAVLLVD